MARNESNPLESYIRGVVMEVIANAFTQRNASENRGNPNPANAARRGIRRRRRARTAKGRVTNPSTDKRLKANREA